MNVGYHPAVQKDVNRILRQYDLVSSRLGDEFWQELMKHIEAAGKNPLRFHPAVGDLRRANLKAISVSLSIPHFAWPDPHHRHPASQTTSAIRSSAQMTCRSPMDEKLFE